MRIDRIPSTPKTCYHGININVECEKCIKYFINEKLTELKILKQKLKIIKTGGKVNYCQVCGQVLKLDRRDSLWYCMNKPCSQSKKNIKRTRELQRKAQMRNEGE